jgi:hypothetical protein
VIEIVGLNSREVLYRSLEEANKGVSRKIRILDDAIEAWVLCRNVWRRLFPRRRGVPVAVRISMICSEEVVLLMLPRCLEFPLASDRNQD